MRFEKLSSRTRPHRSHHHLPQPPENQRYPRSHTHHPCSRHHPPHSQVQRSQAPLPHHLPRPPLPHLLPHLPQSLPRPPQLPGHRSQTPPRHPLPPQTLHLLVSQVDTKIYLGFNKKCKDVKMRIYFCECLKLSTSSLIKRRYSKSEYLLSYCWSDDFSLLVLFPVFESPLSLRLFYCLLSGKIILSSS